MGDHESLKSRKPRMDSIFGKPKTLVPHELPQIELVRLLNSPSHWSYFRWGRASGQPSGRCSSEWKHYIARKEWN